MTIEPVAHSAVAIPRVRFVSAGYDQTMRDALEGLSQEFAKIANLFKLSLNHPDTKGGLRLLSLLQEACEDEVIIASPAALALAKALTALLADSSIGATVDEAFKPITSLAKKQAISDDRQKAAKSKNLTERNFTLAAWQSREDKGQKKAAFGRQYANLIKSKYGTVVTPETIARDWLPK